MKLLKKKIRSTVGATLIIAIVFMMFCIFIGGSILAAASANGARAQKAAAAEQEYLSLRSASLLLTEELRAGTGKVTGLTIENSDGVLSYTLTNRRNNLRELLYICAARQYCEQQAETVTDGNHIAFINLGMDYGPATYPELTVNDDVVWFDFDIQVQKSSDLLETVTVRMQCASDYTISLFFSLDGGETFSSALHMEMKANLTSRTPTALVWNDPVIIKGGTP